MNVASRMESTGLAGKVQISQQTAELLIAAGKSDWLTPRQDKIVTKGGGEMQTYWLTMGVNLTSSDAASTSGSDQAEEEEAEAKVTFAEDGEGLKSVAMQNSKSTRLVEWNCDVLLRLLKQIVAHRKALGITQQAFSFRKVRFAEAGSTVIGEMKETITFPEFNANALKSQEEADNVALPHQVVDQLYDFVTNIAALYNEHPFHNFEHASHVTMSVVKLLSRIVAPSNVDKADGNSLRDHPYGITSHPLTQFACVLGSIVHDCDHQGGLLLLLLLLIFATS
jgi:hypothetical protein